VFTRPQSFGGARRMVVKIGSAVLSDGGTFDRVTFVSLVRDLVRLREQGIELVVVSSGAVALGMERMGRTERPTEMAELQATAAIGQGRLMRLWEDELGVYGVRAAQVLLTHDDLRSRKRFLAARHTLRAVIEMGAVPIVNENDTVAVEEIKMGDNDMLSAQIVSLVGADFLCIVSDVEGLFDRNPKEPGAVRLETVEHIDASVEARAGGSGSRVGSGGMRTKLGAVRQVTEMGVSAIIVGGRTPRVLSRLAAGETLGTWFLAQPTRLSSRKHWIAYALRPAGTLHVDAGAGRALIEKGSSLLPIGLTRVEGGLRARDVRPHRRPRRGRVGARVGGARRRRRPPRRRAAIREGRGNPGRRCGRDRAPRRSGRTRRWPARLREIFRDSARHGAPLAEWIF
jgi:glutamate 5-kinase